MALRESTLRLPRLLARPPCAVSLNNITATTSKPAAAAAATPRLRGYATTTTTTGAAAPDVAELEAESGFANGSVPDAAAAAQFDPVGKARQRKTQLPPSRYQFRPPKYYRGPLHPHRPPPDWDPASRRFVPGPFTLPRVEQTYDASIEADYMTLCYMHTPPGFTPAAVPDRLRAWDDSSPYHANRPRRAPRGGNVLRLLRRPVTFNAVPRLTRITVNTYAKDALKKGSGPLHVAGMALQAITNVRVATHASKSNVPSWGVVKGKTHVGASAELRGEDMFHFFGKLVDVVLPRIKDWPGVKASSGDGSGNITFGLEPKMVALFPEIEANYDMYPAEMIPGCHITIHTSASADRDARLLLTHFGLPFYGEWVR